MKEQDKANDDGRKEKGGTYDGEKAGTSVRRAKTAGKCVFV